MVKGMNIFRSAQIHVSSLLHLICVAFVKCICLCSICQHICQNEDAFFKIHFSLRKCGRERGAFQVPARARGPAGAVDPAALREDLHDGPEEAAPLAAKWRSPPQPKFGKFRQHTGSIWQVFGRYCEIHYSYCSICFRYTVQNHVAEFFDVETLATFYKLVLKFHQNRRFPFLAHLCSRSGEALFSC